MTAPDRFLELARLLQDIRTMDAETKEQRWYKVLDAGGRAQNGGVTPDGKPFQWSLPQSGQPGDWHEVEGRVGVCERGLHLTNDPVKWMRLGARVFLAEGSGDASGPEGDKIAFRRARLLRELTVDELAELRIFSEGVHVVKDGDFFASGSSTVEAYGSSTVRAYDSSTVRASDSSTVEAYDSSTVRASGSSTVRASGSSTVTQWHGDAKIKIDGEAVRIDRRGACVRCYRARKKTPRAG